MSKQIKQFKILLVSSLVSILLMSCSAPTIQLTDSRNAQPSLNPTVISNVSEMPFPNPTAVAADTKKENNSPLQIEGQLRLDHQSISMIAFRDEYVYWLTDQLPDHLYRRKISENSVQLVLQSKYKSDGYLGILPPFVSGDWIVVLDTQSQNTQNWSLRALNLLTHQEKIINSNLMNDAILPPYYSGQGDWIVMAWNNSKSEGCEKSHLETYNLKTDMYRTLDSVCIENKYRWHYGTIYSNTVVAGREWADSNGARSEIIQFEISTGISKTLTIADGSEPSISQKFIIWKEGARWKTTDMVNIFDRETNEVAKVLMPTSFPYIRITDEWLFYQPIGNYPVKIYNAKTHLFQTVVSPKANEGIWGIDISGNRIVWGRIENFDTSNNRNSIIEWTSLPN